MLSNVIHTNSEADPIYIPSEEPEEIERRMEELNRRIAEQKKQIESMSVGIMGTQEVSKFHNCFKRDLNTL